MLRPDGESAEQLELFEASLRVDVAIKCHRAILEHPMFPLGRKPVHHVRSYAIGKDCEFSIHPSAAGAPTQKDQDLLTYCASQIMGAMNDGLRTSPVLGITVHDFLTHTKRSCGGQDYARVKQSLHRLRGTTIQTKIKTGGVLTEEGFGLIEWWRLIEREGSRSPVLQLKLSDWFYRACKAKEILTLDPHYYELEGLDRRIYELVRKHLGDQAAFRITLDRLYEKSGSSASLRRFRYEIKGLVARTDADRSQGRSSPFQHILLGLHDAGSTQMFCAFPNTPEGADERAATANLQGRSLLPVSANRRREQATDPATVGVKDV